MSDNSITVDQEILKSPSCSDFIQISSRSCRVYDEENATNDNLVTKEQCTSDFLSKLRESIHQEVPSWNQENDMREVASMSQFYHLINVTKMSMEPRKFHAIRTYFNEAHISME